MSFHRNNTENFFPTNIRVNYKLGGGFDGVHKEKATLSYSRIRALPNVGLSKVESKVKSNIFLVATECHYNSSPHFPLDSILMYNKSN